MSELKMSKTFLKWQERMRVVVARRQKMAEVEEEASVKGEGETDVMGHQDQHVKEEYASQEDEHVTVPTSQPLRMKVKLGLLPHDELIAIVRRDDGVQFMVTKEYS
jgi:hypothetical protein